MKLPHGKGRLPPFVPVLKDTMKTPAWKALSHGARSLYVVLKGRYSNSPNVMRWFRELQHYGFIVMVSAAHHGVNGQGKAPHWRLTEEWYLGKAPTRDFLSWDGIPFTEKRERGMRWSPRGHHPYRWTWSPRGHHFPPPRRRFREQVATPSAPGWLPRCHLGFCFLR